MNIDSVHDWLKPAAAQGQSVKTRPSELSDSVAKESLSPGKDSVVEPERDAAAITRAEVEEAVSNIQEFVQSVRRDINFSLDDGNGRVVVKVTDAGSGDVIRQIPSEEALRLAENLTEVRSLLFKAEA